MRAIAFGEALIDCFPDRRVVAGAPLHVAVHLARYGWDSALITRVGRDEDGERIRRLLEERGVQLRYLETDPRLPTGRVTIDLSGKEHTFTIDRPAAWDAIEGPPDPADPDAFIYGTLAARDPRSAAALRRSLAAASRALRVFDVNLRPPDVSTAVIRDGIAAADVLKVNQDEGVEIARHLGFEWAPSACFRAAPRLRWVCVTMGGKGAALYAPDGGTWSVPAPAVEVADTVGAGDAFTAGLVDALARGFDPPAALAHARSAAAEIVARRGGLPPIESGERPAP